VSHARYQMAIVSYGQTAETA